MRTTLRRPITAVTVALSLTACGQGVRVGSAATSTDSAGAASPTSVTTAVVTADTITERRKVKHAYEQGIRARKGIEY